MSKKTNAAITAPPFRREHQLNNELDGTAQGQTTGCLPSQPNITMNTSKELSEFLLGDICPKKLNGLAPHLWLCSTPSHTNIPPLHHHAIHGRTIIASEDPALHLIWFTGRIFIKPLPAYLLSHAFWQQYMYGGEPCENKKLVAQSGLGLLRSYIYSICYERDLRIAQEPHLALVPPEVTWKQWCDFSASFEAIGNSEVAPRYHFGKIQLSRLHWLVRIYRWELNYYYIDGGYGESFAKYYGPLLFVFGVFSVLLSAMQVGMAVEQQESHDWKAFWSVCRWFSVLSLVLLAIVAFFLLILFVIKSMDELLWAARAQFRARPRSKIDVPWAFNHALP